MSAPQKQKKPRSSSGEGKKRSSSKSASSSSHKKSRDKSAGKRRKSSNSSGSSSSSSRKRKSSSSSASGSSRNNRNRSRSRTGTSSKRVKVASKDKRSVSKKDAKTDAAPAEEVQSARAVSDALKGKWMKRDEYGVRKQPFRRLLTFFAEQEDVDDLRMMAEVPRCIQSAVEQRVVQQLLKASTTCMIARRNTVVDEDVLVQKYLEEADVGNLEKLTQWQKEKAGKAKERSERAKENKKTSSTSSQNAGDIKMGDGKSDPIPQENAANKSEKKPKGGNRLSKPKASKHKKGDSAPDAAAAPMHVAPMVDPIAA